jgi:hypothetical protein
MCGPTGLLAFGVSLVFEHFRPVRLTVAIRAGLVPVAIGPIAAGAPDEALIALVGAGAFAEFV